ncbi:MAG: ATP-binding cassette domain-containing protein [Desulfuromonadales bacterium]
MKTEPSDPATPPVLAVEHLTIAYDTRKGDVEAVRDVSFHVREGETVGLVGESGCGKSTIAFGIVNFLGPNGKIKNGQVLFQGHNLVGRSERDLKKLRGDRISMVYQDPMQALNPSVRLGEQQTGAYARPGRGDAPVYPSNLRRSAAAGGYRYGHVEQSGAADHGRAHHRSGCHR